MAINKDSCLTKTFLPLPILFQPKPKHLTIRPWRSVMKVCLGTVIVWDANTMLCAPLF